MTTLKVIAANQTEIQKRDGTRIFFSYGTPVAAFVPGKGFIRTVEKYSMTTTRHINAWTGKNAPTVEQSELEVLL